MWDPRAREESLGEIVTRVVENGKEYVRAEIEVVKATAKTKVEAVRPAIVYIICAIFLLQAVLTVFTAALGMALAHWLGAAGGLAVGALIVLLVAGALAAAAVARIKKAFS